MGMSDYRSSSSKVAANSDEVLQWVTYKLGDETYGINVMQVQEVLRHTEIAPVPGAPDYVLGIINLRGNVVTVIDTRSRFGLSSCDITDNTRIVIIESDDQVVGILVDSVAEVVYLRSSEIDSAPNVGTEGDYSTRKSGPKSLIFKCKNLVHTSHYCEVFLLTLLWYVIYFPFRDDYEYFNIADLNNIDYLHHLYDLSGRIV
jgi:purine-binding chemotaxis protein CheW